MATRHTLTAPILALLALAGSPVTAQEGYPLDGTWRGEWGTPGEAPHHVVIVMKWDGENINGLVNPGPSSYEFAEAVLEPSDWTVRFEAETPDGEHVSVVGTLLDIGSYNRRIEGTWTQGGSAHAFTITRE